MVVEFLQLQYIDKMFDVRCAGPASSGSGRENTVEFPQLQPVSWTWSFTRPLCTTTVAHGRCPHAVHRRWSTSSSCRPQQLGLGVVFFRGPAHRCRAGSRVHRDTAPTIWCMRLVCMDKHTYQASRPHHHHHHHTQQTHKQHTTTYNTHNNTQKLKKEKRWSGEEQKARIFGGLAERAGGPGAGESGAGGQTQLEQGRLCLGRWPKEKLAKSRRAVPLAKVRRNGLQHGLISLGQKVGQKWSGPKVVIVVDRQIPLLAQSTFGPLFFLLLVAQSTFGPDNTEQ